MATKKKSLLSSPNKSVKVDFSKINLTPAKKPLYQSLVPNISTPQGKGQTQKDGSIILVNANNQPTGKVLSSSGVGSSRSPSSEVPSSFAPRTISGGSSSKGSSNLPSPIYSAPISSPRTISPTSASGTSFGTSSISSSSLAPSASISLPSAPSYSNPGAINNGGLVSSLSSEYEYDAQSNTFVKKEQDPEAERGLDLQNMLQDLIHQKESVFEDRDIRRQNEEIQQQKQIVADYTAQLNNVVAQQNADLLNLRGIGSREGVTETVYGGQAATINREAAIKALPIQAALAGAQGNLELAQGYLTQLTSWKQEEINNEFTYKMALYSSIKDFVTGSEKNRLDQLEKEADRSYNEKRDNVQAQDAWSKYAIQNGQSSLVTRINALNPASPTFAQELSTIQSQMVDASHVRANAAAVEEASGDYKFSAAQYLVGSSNAGTDVATFKSLRGDVKNLFVNNKDTAQILVDDVGSVKDGSMDYHEALEDINGQNVPQGVKDYFIGLLGAAPPETSVGGGGGFWNWVGSLFTPFYGRGVGT